MLQNFLVGKRGVSFLRCVVETKKRQLSRLYFALDKKGFISWLGYCIYHFEED